MIGLAFLALFLSPEPGDALASGRRLMLDGDLDRAAVLLESVLVDGSDGDRSLAGFLLEAIDQASAPPGEALHGAFCEPPLPPGAAASALSVVPGEAGGWVRGRFGMRLTLADSLLTRGDSLRIWIPLAEDMPIQRADAPGWDVSGLEVSGSIVRLGEPGRLPVLHLSGIAEGGDLTLSMEQEFTAFGAAAPLTDPENLVLPVPGTDPVIDRALASSDWIPTDGDLFILARRIAGGSPQPLVRLAAVLDFASDSIGTDSESWAVRAAEGLPRAVGRTRSADGLGLAAFIASMLRVNGIPCRVAGGWSTAPGGPVRHSRIEVLLEEGSWMPLDLPMALAAGRDGLDGSPFLDGHCDAARVYTFASLEDSLVPGRNSWATCPPGSYPEVEIRSPGGRWTAVPLRAVSQGTVVSLVWRE